MDIEKYITDLSHESKNKRTSAVEMLCEADPAAILPKLADVMLNIGTEETVSACFDIIDHFEASASMADVRMDGWFDKIAEHISHYDEICAVMGERFLAYSFVLSIQIQSLMLDPMTPANTAVNFSIGNDQLQTLSLGEFKVRVVQTLIRDERLPIQPSLPFPTETAVGVIGGRNILLAPLFGITIERVILISLPPALPRYLVAFVSKDGFSIADLNAFLEHLRDQLRADLLGTESEPFSIDLYAVQRAKEAAKRGAYNEVVEILEAWPGILSVLQRAPIRQKLDDEQLQLIGEGVCLLGEALEKENQSQWSEELYKLGLQFIREGDVAARLFNNLGKMLVKKEGYGEAIGYLRRAMALGFPLESILPDLGRAFLKRNCLVAACAVLELSHASEFSGEFLEEDRRVVRAKLESAGLTWDVPLVDLSAKDLS